MFTRHGILMVVGCAGWNWIDHWRDGSPAI